MRCGTTSPRSTRRCSGDARRRRWLPARARATNRQTPLPAEPVLSPTPAHRDRRFCPQRCENLLAVWRVSATVSCASCSGAANVDDAGVRWKNPERCSSTTRPMHRGGQGARAQLADPGWSASAAKPHSDPRSPEPAAEHARRPVRSFVLRQGRMSRRAARAGPAAAPTASPSRTPRSTGSRCSTAAPVWLEIGFAWAKTTTEIAAAHPERDYVGIEVHAPGVGSLLRESTGAARQRARDPSRRGRGGDAMIPMASSPASTCSFRIVAEAAPPQAPAVKPASCTRSRSGSRPRLPARRDRLAD